MLNKAEQKKFSREFGGALITWSEIKPKSFVLDLSVRTYAKFYKNGVVFHKRASSGWHTDKWYVAVVSQWEVKTAEEILNEIESPDKWRAEKN